MFHESETNIRMWRPAEIKTPALPTWTHTHTKEVRIYRQRENQVKHGPAETEERERRQTSVRWRRNGWWEVFMAPTQDCTAAQRWRSLWLEQKKKKKQVRRKRSDCSPRSGEARGDYGWKEQEVMQVKKVDESVGQVSRGRERTPGVEWGWRWCLDSSFLHDQRAREGFFFFLLLSLKTEDGGSWSDPRLLSSSVVL